ncbi:hypothetical protein [Streptomyces sp. NPDC021356]
MGTPRVLAGTRTTSPPSATSPAGDALFAVLALLLAGLCFWRIGGRLA